MDTAILTVMISLAAIGFTMVRLMWRALDKRMDGLDNRMDGLDNRMDRIDNRMDRLESQREADRTKNEQEHGEILKLLRGHGERIARIEGREETRPGIARTGDRAEAPERAAQTEDREEALAS